MLKKISCVQGVKRNSPKIFQIVPCTNPTYTENFRKILPSVFCNVAGGCGCSTPLGVGVWGGGVVWGWPNFSSLSPPPFFPSFSGTPAQNRDFSWHHPLPIWPPPLPIFRRKTPYPRPLTPAPAKDGLWAFTERNGNEREISKTNSILWRLHCVSYGDDAMRRAIDICILISGYYIYMY